MPAAAAILPFATCSRLMLELIWPATQVVPQAFSQDYSGRSVKLNTHFFPVPMSRMSGGMPPFKRETRLHALMFIQE